MSGGLSDADFGYPAWRGYVEWAFKQPEAQEAFTAETGLLWPAAATSPLDQMIDEATGATDKTVEAFVLWASRQWGIEECPQAIRDAARSQEGG